MEEKVDMSDVSDTETVCLSEISDMSDAETLIDLPVDNFLDPPANVVPYPLSAPCEPYLTQNRYNEYEAYRLRNPRHRALLPPPDSIEFSF
ncbi:hypothetical protein PQX77_002588 [Marasmius sp. AFHP31]|nr:hypothetical protein PQX77_002588 [Marasmius sp. AFHP31]